MDHSFFIAGKFILNEMLAGFNDAESIKEVTNMIVNVI